MIAGECAVAADTIRNPRCLHLRGKRVNQREVDQRRGRSLDADFIVEVLPGRDRLEVRAGKGGGTLRDTQIDASLGKADGWLPQRVEHRKRGR